MRATRLLGRGSSRGACTGERGAVHTVGEEGARRKGAVQAPAYCKAEGGAGHRRAGLGVWWGLIGKPLVLVLVLVLVLTLS